MSKGGGDVVKPRKLFITNPAMMHLISLIPLPAAYGAKDRTRNAEVKANRTSSLAGKRTRGKERELQRRRYRISN
jgi:hypothetical protein